MARFRDTEDDDETAIDISPLIDCVFILLIFFIVTTVFVDESGVQVENSEAASASKSDSENVVIEITEKGQVLHEGRVIGVGGIQNIVKRIKKQDESPVVISAEAKASSDLLVRCVDEARLGGAHKVSLTTARGSK